MPASPRRYSARLIPAILLGMCGIAGILRHDGGAVGRSRLDAVLAHLRHRGPDAQGVAELGPCTLLHTRLSILDHAGGAQPMGAPACPSCTGLTVVFNGEIYNHRELRRELQSLGHRFASDHSDTEVLIHGYRQWRDDLPKRLSGMFAFAIWDADARSLFLCRDRVGKKPLYMSRSTGEVVFASMVATLVLAGGAAPRVDRGALHHFMRLGYAGLPSMIDGVTELPPATWLRIDTRGNEHRGVYWTPPVRDPSPTAASRASLESQTLDLIAGEVAARIEADVPIGCFLSGGIDSTLVAALAQRELRRRGSDALRTFSVAMPVSAFDESEIATATAARIGSRHAMLHAGPTGGERGLLDDLRRLTAVSGEPMADSSLLPTYWLSRAAREHVKVALSGDGGDELFGGYDRYRAMSLTQRYRRLIAAIPGGLLRSTNPKSRRARVARLVAAAGHTSVSSRYASMIHLFRPDQIAALLPDIQADAQGGMFELDAWPSDDDHAAAAMRWDFEHYLPFDLLRKVDRASMAVALEVRCPLLGTSVCEFALSRLRQTLMARGRPKSILRDLVAGLGLTHVTNLPKRGFAIPIGDWLRRELREDVDALLTRGGLESLGFRRAAVESILKEHNEGTTDHTHRVFALVSLALWTDWLKNPAPPSQ